MAIDDTHRAKEEFFEKMKNWPFYGWKTDKNAQKEVIFFKKLNFWKKNIQKIYNIPYLSYKNIGILQYQDPRRL